MNQQQGVAAMTAAAYEAAWMQSMTGPQRALFLAEMHRVRRSTGTAVLLALFLGGLGAHRFYLGDLFGIVYVVFCWTFIPMIVAVLEAIVMTSRVEAYNKQQAHLVAARILAYAAAAPAPPPAGVAADRRRIAEAAIAHSEAELARLDGEARERAEPEMPAAGPARMI